MTNHGQIPRRIIQTAPTHDLPPLGKASAASLKLLHPDWEYVFFDDEAAGLFVAEQFPEYVTTFASFPHQIQKFDFFRYLAVYRLGGFYFDLDVLLWQTLDDLRQQGCVFPFEELTINQHLRNKLGIDWEIGNYGFGATAGHPFLRQVIANCDRYVRDLTWADPMIRGVPRYLRREFEVLNTTGPGLLTRTLAENPGLSRDVTILGTDDVLDERRWHQFGTYGTHLMSGSWRQRANPISRRLRRAWEAWARRHSMAASRKLGPARTSAVTPA